MYPLRSCLAQGVCSRGVLGTVSKPSLGYSGEKHRVGSEVQPQREALGAARLFFFLFPFSPLSGTESELIGFHSLGRNKTGHLHSERFIDSESDLVQRGTSGLASVSPSLTASLGLGKARQNQTPLRERELREACSAYACLEGRLLGTPPSPASRPP